MEQEGSGSSGEQPTVDYYHVLDVDYDASESEIRSQYRKLALKNHPDKHNNSDAAKRHFQLIGEAARVLSDPTLRAQYNASARWNVDCFSVDEYLRRFKEFMLSAQGSSRLFVTM